MDLAKNTRARFRVKASLQRIKDLAATLSHIQEAKNWNALLED